MNCNQTECPIYDSGGCIRDDDDFMELLCEVQKIEPASRECCEAELKFEKDWQEMPKEVR